MTRSIHTSAEWLLEHEPEARIIFSEATIALGRAAECWALVATHGQESANDDLGLAVDAEVQLASLLREDVRRLIQLTRLLVRILEREAAQDRRPGSKTED